MQFLTKECDDALLEQMIAAKIDLDIQYKGVTKELVDILHENALEINCWTVDDPVVADQLVEWGVDYITSNILE